MSVSTRLRKVGGSVMLSLPPALLQMLDLKAEDLVEVSVDDGALVIAPKRRPAYVLDTLLAACDPDSSAPDSDRIWTDGNPTGQELI